MVDITKLDMTKIWAASGDKVQPSDSLIASGWLVQQIPRQTWNWFENRQDQNIAYLLQKGIPEWDSTTEYIINKSYVQRAGIVYKAIVTSTGVDPTGNPATWVKAFSESSASLEALRVLIPATNTFPYFTNATTAATASITPFARTILDDADAASMRATLSAQSSHINLTTLSTVTAATNALPYFTGTNTATTTLLTSFGRSLIDDADAVSGRATLGLGDVATRNIGTSTGTAAAGDDSRIVNSLQKGNNLSELTSTTIARSNLDLGSAAVADLTTSNVDNTTGRALKTKDFGIGATGDSPSSTDCNTMLANGDYRLVSPFTNGPTASTYSVTVTTYNDDVTQVAVLEGGATPRIYSRKRSGPTTWNAWVETYTTGNTSADVRSILGAADYAAIRSQLGLTNKAEAGANSDITSLSGLTTPLSAAQGGTGVTSNTGTGVNVLSNSPSLTGTPTVPTALSSSNSTQIASTAFVKAVAVGNPVGTIIAYPVSTAPTGFLKANGAAISRTTYADLFAVIGTTYGAGDGSTTFNVPDLRGEFIRGLDDGRGVDTSRTIGSSQTDLLKSHTHTFQGAGAVANLYPSAVGYQLGAGGGYADVSNAVVILPTGGTETRPRNIALLFCIKY